MDLVDCDPIKNEKSNKATAEKLLEFVNGKLNLEKHQSQLTFTCDHAIYQGIEKHLNALGIDDLKNRLIVCGGHDVCNFHKNQERETNKNIDHNDTKSRFFNIKNG